MADLSINFDFTSFVTLNCINNIIIIAPVVINTNGFIIIINFIKKIISFPHYSR